MVKKLKDLENVFADITQYSNVLPMEVKIWIDTNQKDCSAIYGELKLDCGTTISKYSIFELLRKINTVTPIITITIRNQIFHISKTEEYANKPCEVYLDVSKR